MTWYAGNEPQREFAGGAARGVAAGRGLRPAWAGTEAPTKTPTEAPEKTETDDLDEEIRRIIREVPDPTPQPGGE